MSKKISKILITILVLLCGLSITTTTHAYEIFGWEITSTSEDKGINDKYYKNKRTRVRQHSSKDNALLFCVQGMQNYKATLSENAFNTLKDNGYIDENGNFLDASKNVNAETEVESTSYPNAPTSLPDGENVTMMYQRSQITEDQIKGNIDNQEFAYLIATAEEKGLLDRMYTQYGVWALGINSGRKEEPNALAQEAMNYGEFYKKIHGGESFDDRTTMDNKKKVDVAVDTTKGTYTVGWFKVKYPTAKTGTQGSGGNVNKEDEDENIKADDVEILNKMLTKSKTIYEELEKITINNNYTLGENKSDLYKANTKARRKSIADYKAIHSSITNIDNLSISELEAAQEKLQTAVNNLHTNSVLIAEPQVPNEPEKVDKVEDPGPEPADKTSKEHKKWEKNKEKYDKYVEYLALKAEYDAAKEQHDRWQKQHDAINTIRKYDFTIGEKKESDSMFTDNTEQGGDDNSAIFSFVSKVSVIGYDADGKEVGTIAVNDTNKSGMNMTGMDIVDTNENQITNPVYKMNGKNVTTEKVTANLPGNNQKFYVKLKLNDDRVKSIKVQTEITYLDYCTGTFYKYTGNWYQWTWVHYKSDPVKYDTCGGTAESPCAKAAEHGGTCPHTYHTYYDFHWYLTRQILEKNPQEFIGVELINANVESLDVDASKKWKTITRDAPIGKIDITMELGGYVKLDEYTDKQTAPDDKLGDNDKNVPGAEVWLYQYKGEKINEAKPIRVTTTDENGHYLFTELNAQKKYYVQFVYDGMKFTNATYDMGQTYNTDNWNKASKAQEDSKERENFNKKFGEIGSYPANYEVTYKIFKDKYYIQADPTNKPNHYYNQTNLREDITDIFKEISTEIKNQYTPSYDDKGNENGLVIKDMLEKACNQIAEDYTKKHPEQETEIRRIIQYAVDCRMNAYTSKGKVDINYNNQTTNTYVYPVFDIFTVTSNSPKKIAGTVYNPIYEGQRNISYLLQSRASVDLSLAKRVEEITVSINGGKTTYEIGSKEGEVGVRESDYNEYLAALRKDYAGEEITSEEWLKYNKTEYNLSKETVELFTRKEDIETSKADNNTINSNGITQNVELKSYGLVNGEKLDIEVIYRLRVRNNSPTWAAVTEIVDYYDKDYELVGAYYSIDNARSHEKSIIEDKNKCENSKYGVNTEYKDKNNCGYNTVYIQPNEKRLNDSDYQDIYVVMKVNGRNKAGELLVDKLKDKNDKYEILNTAEINGYKTYINETGNGTPGLIDSNSNPGNYDINNNNNGKNFKNIGGDTVEDDTSKAKTIVFKLGENRTLSGNVFEDKAGPDANNSSYEFDDKNIQTGKARVGNGKYEYNKDSSNNIDRAIQGVKVELYEVKNNALKVVGSTTTDQYGGYEFKGYIPGNYTIRYTYGHNDETVVSFQNSGATNKTSYNGQDYQSTVYNPKGSATTPVIKDEQNRAIVISYLDNNYWYTDTDDSNKPRLSDAKDDANRVTEVQNYSNIDRLDGDKNLNITNHKAEVFNAYESTQPNHIMNEPYKLENLVKELEDKTCRYAYTPEIEVEVEYATETIDGGMDEDKYAHNITGVDFGIVERPRSELVIDQDISRIKVVAADGATVLFDSDGTGTTSNLQWVKGTEQQKLSNGQYLYRGGKIVQPQYSDEYDKNELVNIIMDEELISGAKLEVTYRFTVTNNSESDTDANGNEVTTRAKTIVNYVPNNLTFDEKQNTGWKVVKASEIQEEGNSTLTNKNVVDLSTQAVILETTTDDKTGLTKALKPGYSTQAELTLTKVLSAESTLDDLTYTNLIEIVEIDNTVGRYDHGATPGNQSLEKNPAEHDAAGASKYDNGMGNPSNPNDPNDPNDPGNPPDGVIIITPPTGSNYIYYVIGITSAVILAAGIYLIKKFVIDRK